PHRLRKGLHRRKLILWATAVPRFMAWVSNGISTKRAVARGFCGLYASWLSKICTLCVKWMAPTRLHRFRTHRKNSNARCMVCTVALKFVPFKAAKWPQNSGCDGDGRAVHSIERSENHLKRSTQLLNHLCG